jgi:hypothetical protein
MDMRAIASVGAIVLGVLLILGAIGTATMVRSELADQNITIPDDGCLPGRQVAGPFTAYCQAQIIEEHARAATDGLAFAEMDQDDPRREVAMNASFLRASLFTSILAFGVSAMAAGIGVLFVLIGLGIRDVKQRVVDVADREDQRVS